ncbi:MAG: ornithine cyclodeaminase family protein [Deinococcota bacterium]
MHHFSDDDVRRALSWQGILTALEEGFRHKTSFQIPERIVLEQDGKVYLTMPCLDADGWFGIKQVSIIPDNSTHNLPTVQAHYSLSNPQGTPVVSASATLLTQMRTAGTSALTARYLAPQDARTLLVIGTGSLAPWQAEAHAQVRDYSQILVWGRDSAKTQATRDDISSRLPQTTVEAVDATQTALAEACKQADVISIATTAKTPIVQADWLTDDKPRHLDLVGAFTPEMAEVDAATVKRAAVYIDDLAGARSEAGDLIQACEADWSFDEVVAELAELVQKKPQQNHPLTLFKSVGLALEDLQTAKLLVKSS